MKTTMIILLSLLFPPQDSLLVVSWNVENFLDYRTDTTGRHTAGRFYTKCNSVCKTLLLIAEQEGRLPDAVALMEIGDRFVLERLVHSTPLRKLDYRIVHYESPDRRGIDCALLYRAGSLRLQRSRPVHLVDTTGAVMPTRDILVAEFDSLCILVNHHPSKVGADSERRRGIAMTRMNELMDSLAGVWRGADGKSAGSWRGSEGPWRKSEGSWRGSEGSWRESEGSWRGSEGSWRGSEGSWRGSDFPAGTCATKVDSTLYDGAGIPYFFGPAPSGVERPVLSVGDFNDDVWQAGGPGTIKYNGSWEKIDGHFARGLTVSEKVFASPLLSEEDRTWGGTKPRRAFSGPRWLGGVSDHYPIILWICRE